MSLSWPGQERFSFPGQIAKDADVMTKRLNRVMVSFIKKSSFEIRRQIGCESKNDFFKLLLEFHNLCL